jgi:hypothetical protein
MGTLRSEALRIFLQHSLSSALAAESAIQQWAEHAGGDTVDASASWVRICRNAQTVCGVFGLLAIDRAESKLFYCLQRDCSFVEIDKVNNKHLAHKFEKSGRCYVNALLCQLSQDTDHLALWTYSGAVYDCIEAVKLAAQLDEDGHQEYCRQILSDWKTAEREYKSKCEADPSPEIAALRAEIALKYCSAIAHTEVHLAAVALHGRGYDPDHGQRAADSAEHLVQALEYTENALSYNKPGEEEVQDLWRLCVGYMRSAAVVAEAGKSHCRKCPSWKKICKSLSDLASKLGSILRTLRDLPVGVPARDIAELKQHLAQAFEMVNECPLVCDPAGPAARNFDTAAIDRFIGDIAFAVEKLSTRVGPERDRMQRLLLKADRVNVDQSPAHQYIKQCWLHAAEQMRLAVASTRERESAQHKRYSSLLEKLAMGPLAMVAHYFWKADRSASQQEQELWTAAAKTLLEAAVAPMQRCIDRCLWEAEKEKAVQYVHEEEVLDCTARQYADAAACCDRVHVDQDGASPSSPEQLLRIAELQLRLTLIEGDAVPDEKRCREGADIDLNRYEKCRGSCEALLTWCAQQLIPVTTLRPPGAPAVSAEQQRQGLRKAEARMGRATWLCEVLTPLARVYARAGEDSAVVGAADKIRCTMDKLVNQIDDDKAVHEDLVLLISVVVEAARSFLSGHTEECLVWCAAADQYMYPYDGGVHEEVHNKLVAKAWELREATCKDTNRNPALLMAVDLQDHMLQPERSAVIDCIADTFIETERVEELTTRAHASEAGQKAVTEATQQLEHSTLYVDSYLRQTFNSAAPDQDKATLLEKGVRAMLAGRWYAAAAQAAIAEQWEVNATFLRAALYVQEAALTTTTTHHSGGSEDTHGYTDEHRPVATKAGERFARAAEALRSGDRELYELWMDAAEATAATLQDSGGSGDAVILAQAAQQRQDEVHGRRSTDFKRAALGSAINTDMATVESGQDASAVGEKRKRQREEG